MGRYEQTGEGVGDGEGGPGKGANAQPFGDKMVGEYHSLSLGLWPQATAGRLDIYGTPTSGQDDLVVLFSATGDVPSGAHIEAGSARLSDQGAALFSGGDWRDWGDIQEIRHRIAKILHRAAQRQLQVGLREGRERVGEKNRFRRECEQLRAAARSIGQYPMVGPGNTRV